MKKLLLISMICSSLAVLAKPIKKAGSLTNKKRPTKQITRANSVAKEAQRPLAPAPVDNSATENKSLSSKIQLTTHNLKHDLLKDGLDSHDKYLLPCFMTASSVIMQQAFFSNKSYKLRASIIAAGFLSGWALNALSIYGYKKQIEKEKQAIAELQS